MVNINISFVGLDATEALKSYVSEKLTKHQDLLLAATKIDVTFRENIHARGVKGDFKIDINVFLPNALVRVEETGSDMYAIIDKASDVLARRIKRYNDRRSNWDGNIPWRVLEADEALSAISDEELHVDDYVGYVPKITTRKKLKDMTPMSEGEAIEKMELMGYRQLLFKSINTGKISMVYSREDGGYGLVEPGDELSI